MSTTVEKIKDRLNILDVVGGYVKLQKSGKHWKGKSPFTNEKTPSFFVSPERGMYHCFSSNKGGDIFTFIQEMEGVDFRGALKILAERAGVPLENERTEDRGEREELYAVVEEATRFFEAQLQKSASSREYLTSRGVTEATTQKWRIGFAPNEWRSLCEHLKAQGFKPELIMKAGLSKGSERSAEPYDTFRNRIMFPISDASGRVVGFSGRDQSGDPEAPKYVNSPETPLYEKSRTLFGYDKAKQGIRTFDFTLIVEGQFDLVLSHQAGYTNAVAISGTALTEAHVEQILRLSQKAVLALDSDKAGIASAQRSAAIMLTRDMDVKVARIDGGKDPADLVREDPKLLKHCIGAAVHVIPFLIDTIKRTTKDERTYKLRVREEVIPFVTLMQNRMDAEHFEKVIADATETTVDAVHFEVERVREERRRSDAKVPARVVTQTPDAKPAMPATPARTEDIVFHLYGMLLSLQSNPTPYIAPDKLGRHLAEILGEERIRALEDWSSEEKNRAVFSAERTSEDMPEKTLREHITRLLHELSERTLKERLKDTRTELAGAERAGDTTLAHTLLTLCSTLQQKLGKVKEQEFIL